MYELLCNTYHVTHNNASCDNCTMQSKLKTKIANMRNESDYVRLFSAQTAQARIGNQNKHWSTIKSNRNVNVVIDNIPSDYRNHDDLLSSDRENFIHSPGRVKSVILNFSNFEFEFYSIVLGVAYGFEFWIWNFRFFF